jgi:hypothetical protein
MTIRTPQPTLTNVASSATTVSLLAASGASQRYIWNDSTAILYLAYGSVAASTSNYTVQVASQGLHTTTYNGAIQAIWASANGNARVTELI